MERTATVDRGAAARVGVVLQQLLCEARNPNGYLHPTFLYLHTRAGGQLGAGRVRGHGRVGAAAHGQGHRAGRVHVALVGLSAHHVRLQAQPGAAARGLALGRHAARGVREQVRENRPRELFYPGDGN